MRYSSSPEVFRVLRLTHRELESPDMFPVIAFLITAASVQGSRILTNPRLRKHISFEASPINMNIKVIVPRAR